MFLSFKVDHEQYRMISRDLAALTYLQKYSRPSTDGKQFLRCCNGAEQCNITMKYVRMHARMSVTKWSGNN